VDLSAESQAKRVYAFFDGQNLFNAAKEAFGYDWPNYDPLKLATAICRIQGWKLERIHFYTGIPEQADPRHSFWNKKLQIMGTRGVQIFTRPLRYREKFTYSKDSAYTMGRVPTEKGIDVRLALDVVRFAHEDLYDVALIFSQDQDLSEAVDELKRISLQTGRSITVASAFPVGPTTRNNWGLLRSRHIRIDKSLYDACLDPTDYRAPRG
jgi:uncharacterized LabA/DUF88 family protein